MFLNLTGFEFFLDTDLILKLPQRGQPFYSPESRATKQTGRILPFPNPGRWFFIHFTGMCLIATKNI